MKKKKTPDFCGQVNRREFLSSVGGGFPALAFQGRNVYQATVPSPMIKVSYLTATIGATAFGYTWFGVIGLVLGMLAAYGAAAWLRSTRERTVAYVVLIGAGVLLVGLAVLGMVAPVAVTN